MNTRLSILIGFLLIGLINSCTPFRIVRGDGNLVTKELTLNDYDKIEVAHSLEIIYTQSEDTPSLTVTVDENIWEKYDIQVDGSTLKIKPKEEFKRSNFFPTQFTIVTHSKGLRKVNLAGSTTFNFNSPFIGEDLDIDLAGSGTINMTDSVTVNKLDIDMAGSATLNAYQLNGSNFEGNIAGSGKLNMGGSFTSASFDIAGSGKVYAFDMQVEDMKCRIAGSGKIEISVNNSISADVAGSGHIKYKGDAQIINKKIAGSGSVKKVD